MMKQFRDAKAAHPDCLLFFRMGDFYELFFDDAVTAAAALDITLTKRGQHQGEEVPMAGVPAHSHEGYLHRLIRQGFRVAICDQVESPAEAKKRPGKTIVRREVTRVATPGTVTEDGLLDARANNYLVALAAAGGRYGLAAGDISTGTITTEAPDLARLGMALERLDPSEILVSEKMVEQPELYEMFGQWRQRLTVLPTSRFDSQTAARRLEALFGALDAHGAFTRPEVAAGGVLVDYIELTQKGRLPRLDPPRRLADGAVMEIDAATRRNLELTRTLSGDRSGSLLATVDRTLTGAGARLLAARLSAPLTDPGAIADRLDGVQYLTEDEALRAQMRDALRRTPGHGARARSPDARPRRTARLGGDPGRFGPGRRVEGPAGPAPNGGPAAAPRRDSVGHGRPFGGARAIGPGTGRRSPAQSRDGVFIAQGYAPQLDELRTLRDEEPPADCRAPGPLRRSDRGCQPEDPA